MANAIKCPHCGKSIEVSEVLRHQIEEEVSRDVGKKHEQELASLREKVLEEVEQKLEKKYKDEQSELKEELEEQREKNAKFRENELKLRKRARELEEKEEELELELEKKLSDERRKIEDKVAKRAEEEYRLKNKEKEKVIEDLKKALEDARRKASQGSQQLQGEILELDLEHLLRNEFMDDVIEEVGKGVKGADVRHIVRSPRRRECGVILWESKRTKQWSDGWITKLKSDLRAERANIPVIVSTALPDEATSGIGLKDGVWICSYEFILPLAILLRDKLYEVAKQKFVNEGAADKKEALYNYVTSHEFSQQVEALVEVYSDMQLQVTKERAAFEKQWKQREAHIKRLLVSTSTIYGSMQGLAGASMPQVKGLEIDMLESGE